VAVKLYIPIQAVVNRSELLQIFMVDTPIVDPTTGRVLQILKDPPWGAYGPVPGDPAWFSPMVDSRRAVCQVLSSYALGRCLRAGGYF
jgi:hypothetical protein